MTKVLVLYYSSYGHIETMADYIAEGARSVEGVTVDIRRVPELVPAEIASKAGIKLIKLPHWLKSRNWPSTMRLPSAPQPALATWRRRCVTFSIKPVDCGQRAS